MRCLCSTGRSSRVRFQGVRSGRGGGQRRPPRNRRRFFYEADVPSTWGVHDDEYEGLKDLFLQEPLKTLHVRLKKNLQAPYKYLEALQDMLQW